jgi:hypothetical protein
MADTSFEERLLRRAAATMAYPPTPALRASVVERIAAADPRVPYSERFPRTPWYSLGAAAALVVAAVVVLAVPTSRDAVADFFGVEGSKVEPLATAAPGTTPTPLPTPADIASGLQPVSIADAEEGLGFAPLLPGGKQPDGTFLITYADQPVAVLRYGDFDLWETRLVAEGSFGKGVPTQGRVEDLTLAGVPARWITGAPHLVYFLQPDGRYLESSLRTVEKSTLIWNDGATFFRMETDLPREEAVAVAESLR